MNRIKPSAAGAWKMLLLSLPKGIAAFVTVVAGLSVSLPLSVFLVGLPLLAETLVIGTRLLEAERLAVVKWKRGMKRSGEGSGSEYGQPSSQWGGWGPLLAVLGQARSYRSVLYGLLQLPIGIAAFTVGVVLPVTAWAVTLSPLAHWISTKYFDYELFGNDIVWSTLLPTWTGYERSWLAAGVGAVFVLLLPIVLRTLGKWYAGWVLAASGPETKTAPQPAVSSAESVVTH